MPFQISGLSNAQRQVPDRHLFKILREGVVLGEEGVREVREEEEGVKTGVGVVLLVTIMWQMTRVKRTRTIGNRRTTSYA